MLEIIAVAIVGVLGFYSGWKTREDIAARRVDELLSNVEEEFTDEIRKNVIKISIEHHEGVYYVYGLEDKAFMAQGKTRKELESSLAKNFPGKTFAAEHKNLVEVGFVS
jgi:hypothetical protein